MAFKCRHLCPIGHQAGGWSGASGSYKRAAKTTETEQPGFYVSLLGSYRTAGGRSCGARRFSRSRRGRVTAVIQPLSVAGRVCRYSAPLFMFLRRPALRPFAGRSPTRFVTGSASAMLS